MVEALGVMSSLDDAVPGCRQEKQAQGQKQRGESADLAGAVGGGQALEPLLEEGAVLKPEQHL